MKKAFNPTGVGPDIYEKIIRDSYEFEDIPIEQIKGILLLYLIFNLLAIFQFILEICYKKSGSLWKQIENQSPK